MTKIPLLLVLLSLSAGPLHAQGSESVLVPAQQARLGYQRRAALAPLDSNMNFVVDPGQFEVLVGSSSTDIRVKDTFESKAQ